MKAIARTIVAAALIASPLAQADETVARVVELSGNVLVSRDFNIASTERGARLGAGARVLVTANSSAVVEYEGGCRVRLGAGQKLEIRVERACTAFAESAASETVVGGRS